MRIRIRDQCLAEGEWDEMSADILVVYKKNFEAVHDRSIDSIEKVLQKFVNEQGIRVDMTAREKVRRSDFIGRDLVIVIGGDGTLTSIAHSVDAETPVMGVNSHPKEEDKDGSVGFFMGSDTHHFEEDLVSALEGTAIMNVLPRLQAEIVTTSGNVIRCDPALNDLLIANTHQYQPSRYRLQRGKGDSAIDTIQTSSGMLFSTYVGKGAWFRHTFDIENQEFLMDTVQDHYLAGARELPLGERREGEHWIWTKQPTTLTSDMHRGYVVSDGWDEYHFTRGATISVSIDGPPLRLLTFRRRILEKI